MELAILSKTTTMTSREIAELTEKDHAHVMRDIRLMLEVLKKDASSFGGIYRDAYGREKPCFLLDAELTLTLVSGYDITLRHRVVVKLKEMQQELEAQVAPAPAPAPQNSMSAVVQVLADSLSIAELLGVPLHLAQTEAVKETLRLTGRDFSNMLRLAPAQSNIARLEEALEPTELGKSLGLSAIKLNQILCAAGLQVKALDGWEPTAKGAPYAIRHHWAKGDKSGYNWKWKTSVLELLKDSK